MKVKITALDQQTRMVTLRCANITKHGRANQPNKGFVLIGGIGDEETAGYAQGEPPFRIKLPEGVADIEIGQTYEHIPNFYFSK